MFLVFSLYASNVSFSADMRACVCVCVHGRLLANELEQPQHYCVLLKIYLMSK